jgi:hypothetical protein
VIGERPIETKKPVEYHRLDSIRLVHYRILLPRSSRSGPLANACRSAQIRLNALSRETPAVSRNPNQLFCSRAQLIGLLFQFSLQLPANRFIFPFIRCVNGPAASRDDRKITTAGFQPSASDRPL